MDNYTKIRVIGKGSYGEVWSVRHKRDKKSYVLKKMNLQNASKRERKAADQEAKLLAKLKHPNIVSYKDSFETEDGFLYIAMGYCEGGDLYNRLKEQKGSSLEERQVVEWFVQIAMALQYMHERHILHRDLKTQNIFLTKSKIIKVGDLGIARVLDHSSDMATTLIGTPYYMSPELFSNKPYNHKSDVWALGCCVYEMATLKHAFNAKDMNSLVYKILRGKMPLMPKQYSPELVTLIKAMLNSAPEKRPSVNRILRDPYIKKNIALFLEGTRRKVQNSRPSSNGSQSSRKSSREDRGESARSSESSESQASRVGSRLRGSPAEVELVPLQPVQDLHPIKEEITDRDSVNNSYGNGGRGDADPSRVRRNSAPSHRERSKTPPYYRDRSFTPPQRDRSHTPPQHQQPRPLPKVPVSRDKHEIHSQFLHPNLHAKPPAPALAKELPPSGRGHSPNRIAHRRKKKRHKNDENRSSESSDSSVLSRSSSPPTSQDAIHAKHDARSIFNKPKQVVKPRPLPPRPSESNRPVVSSAAPKVPEPARSAGERESGYGSVVSSVNSSRDPEDTPRQSMNVSARARRREKKESETPRTSRSVDVEQRPRRNSDSDVPVLGPGRRSVDHVQANNQARQRDAGQRPKSAQSYQRQQEDIEEMVKKKRQELSRVNQMVKQPSIGGSSSSEEDVADLNEDTLERDKRSNNKQSTLILHCPSPSPSSSPTGELEEAELDKQREGKEMTNFLTLLDHTLNMNQEGEKSEEEEEGDGSGKDPAHDTIKEEDEEEEVEEVEAKEEKEEKKDEEMKEEEDEGEVLQEKLPGPGITYNVKSPKVYGSRHAPVVTVPDVDSPAPRRRPQPQQITPGPAKTLGTSTRLMDRISVLRKDCIQGLGVLKLKRAYDILDNIEGDEVEAELVDLLGRGDFEIYAGKIWQLKFCEEAAFGLI